MRSTPLLYTLVLTLLLLAAPASAQNGDEGLTVYAGVAMYPDPAYDSLVLVEFPFSLTRHELEFFRPVESDSALYARVFAQVDLFGASGLPIDSASTYFSVRAHDAIEAAQPGIRLFNKLILFLKPGVYSARLTVIDVSSKKSGTAFLDRVVVEPPSRDRITLGGPLLAYRATVVKDTTAVNMRLVRNGFMVLPNPVGVFSTEDSIMYCYGEVYNLRPPETDAGAFRLQFELLDSRDSLLRAIGSRTSQREGDVMAFGEPLDIKSWLPGGYRLRVIAEDIEEAAVDTAVVPFAIVSPAGYLALAEEISSRDEAYDTLQLQQKISLVWHLLSLPQKQTLERLSADGKRTYLAQFWNEYKSHPAADGLVSRNELIQRLLHVNNRFSLSESRDDGWRTDRGRVYMIYGAPDEIDDATVPLGAVAGVGANNVGRPYSIWHYREVQEGKVFVFVDQYTNNEYRLVHSNVNGEIYNKIWADWLLTGGTDFEQDY